MVGVRVFWVEFCSEVGDLGRGLKTQGRGERGGGCGFGGGGGRRRVAVVVVVGWGREDKKWGRR